MNIKSLDTTKSQELFERAKKVIPGGSNQAHRIVEPFPFLTAGKGSKIRDIDGNEYIDYHAAFGPIILGYHYPTVDRAVIDAMNQGADLYGVGGTEMELKLHEKIVEHFPSVDMSLLCTSGSEATYFAIRVARAFTGRKKLIKFQGHYHGFHDTVLMNIISESDKIGKKDLGSAGILDEIADQTVVLPWNDLPAVESAVKKYRDEIAAIILEPIPHNIGCVLPQEGYIEALREITEKNDIILIFDEVITGLRHNLGGLQSLWNITPDITTLGKSMANGYPISAVGGKKEIMMRTASAPGGDVFFGGTFNGHPGSVAASLATISELEGGKVHEHIFRLGKMMRDGLRKITGNLGMNAYTAGFGSVFLTYFMNGPVIRYRDLLSNDTHMFLSYRKSLLKHGIHMLAKDLKRNHISYSHTENDIQCTLEASEKVLTEMSLTNR